MSLKQNNVDQLKDKVRSLLSEDGYSFSEEDKALLEAILVELEEISEKRKGYNLNDFLRIISLLLRFLKFFGIDEIDKLF